MKQVLKIHGDEHRPYGPDAIRPFPPYHIKLFSDVQVVVAGLKWVLTIPPDMDELELLAVETSLSTPSSSGDVTLQIYNDVQVHDMLSTPATISAGDYSSDDTSAAESWIDTGHNVVNHKDRLKFIIDDDGTGAKGLEVICYFR